jgi:ligand-binding SRPBCC domain-containing protein
MTTAVTFEIRSEVAAPAAEVWAHVTTMAGVNEELDPWVRMTHPEDMQDLASAPPDVLGGVAFQSWLLALGFLPFDRHALTLLSVDDRGPGGGSFVEDSTSWMQTRWRHERSVETTSDRTSAVTDRLVIEPRVGLARPLVKRIVPWLFTRRHRTLVARFGQA